MAGVAPAATQFGSAEKHFEIVLAMTSLAAVSELHPDVYSSVTARSTLWHLL